MRNSRYVVRWTVALGMVVPAALAATSYALQAAWWDSLPTVVPHHWNAAGQPDAFGSRASFPIATTVLAVALPALMMVFVLPGLLRGRRGPTYRLLTAFALGMAVLGSVLTTGDTWLHRGIAEGGPWPSTTAVTVSAIVAGVTCGTLAFFAQPRQELTRPGMHTPAALVLGEQERAVWMHTTAIPAWGRAGLALGAVGLLAGAVGLLASGNAAGGVPMVVALVVVILAAAMATAFRVRVDQLGISAVSMVGWPRFTVAAEDVGSVAVVRVDGLGEFGGFGIRSALGATGIIMRNGEALEVTRRSGKRLVITVDDAETAAALLMAIAKRAGAVPPVAP